VVGDWVDVFKELASNLSDTHIKRFAGLNPKSRQDLEEFAECLGIDKTGLEDVETIMAEGDDCWGDLADDLGSCLDGLGLENSITKARIFKSWVKQGRSLLTFSNVLLQLDEYSVLNAMLSLVSILPFKTFLIVSVVCGVILLQSVQ
jgi:hypothetical protein